MGAFGKRKLGGSADCGQNLRREGGREGGWLGGLCAGAPSILHFVWNSLKCVKKAPQVSLQSHSLTGSYKTTQTLNICWASEYTMGWGQQYN